MRIDFDDRLRTGIEEIDAQHRTLVDLYNELDEALWQGKANRQMEIILAHLFRYTKTHFAHEEMMLAATDYPHLAQHQWEHRRLVDKLKGFIVRHRRSGDRISTEMLDFVRRWVTHHIMESDMAYAEHVLQHPDLASVRGSQLTDAKKTAEPSDDAPVPSEA